MVEVVAAFWRHASTYYRRQDGTPTKEVKNLRDALRPLERLHGDTAAVQFGPRALRAVRDEMIRLGWCRKNINKQVGRIRHVFKWAAGQEMLPASVYHALQAVEPLKPGRPAARESKPVPPVNEAVVRAAAQFMSAPVRAMVELQLATAMRPGEVTGIRTCDVDTTGTDGT